PGDRQGQRVGPGRGERGNFGGRGKKSRERPKDPGGALGEKKNPPASAASPGVTRYPGPRAVGTPRHGHATPGDRPRAGPVLSAGAAPAPAIAGQTDPSASGEARSRQLTTTERSAPGSHT